MTLAELCVKRPVFAVMLITFLVVLGVFSFRDLGVDLFPKADPATVVARSCGTELRVAIDLARMLFTSSYPGLLQQRSRARPINSC